MTKFLEKRNGRRGASKDIIVLYHSECTDGFTAAWVAYTIFGRKAQYIPVEHQVSLPEGLVNKEIYTLDFTYPREVMVELKAKNKKITSIDHHALMKDVVLETEGGVFDNDHSGAMLAWKYFHPDEPVPFLIRVVEDVDLFRFAMPETESISHWLDTFDFSFKIYDKIAKTLESPMGLKRAMKRGELILDYCNKLISRLVQNTSYEVNFEGYKVLAANTELFHSEVATILAEGRPFGIVWRMRRKGIYTSLRSKEGGVNVAELAKKYGGGGHEHAAGFLVPTLADLPFKPIEKHD